MSALLTLFGWANHLMIRGISVFARLKNHGRYCIVGLKGECAFVYGRGTFDALRFVIYDC